MRLHARPQPQGDPRPRQKVTDGGRTRRAPVHAGPVGQCRLMELLTRMGATLASIVRGLRDRIARGFQRRSEPVADRQGFRRFLHTRSNYIAQYSLYGYLRTRTGVRFPELFNDDPFVRSINIAKWHIWLACLADLSVYAGGLVLHRARAPAGAVGRLVSEAVDGILAEVGVPEEAGAGFTEHAGRVRARIALCDWESVSDDESAFSESPAALVHYAPVTDELRQLDEEIVKNSVRFRWQEIRRALRRDLDAERVLAGGND